MKSATIIKTAGVREFKARLSRYLRDVQAGETVLVTDRGRVVAEVKPPGEASQNLSPEDIRYREWVVAGRIIPARSPGRLKKLWKSFRGLRLPSGTAQQVLDADREERF